MKKITQHFLVAMLLVGVTLTVRGQEYGGATLRVETSPKREEYPTTYESWVERYRDRPVNLTIERNTLPQPAQPEYRLVATILSGEEELAEGQTPFRTRWSVARRYLHLNGSTSSMTYHSMGAGGGSRNEQLSAEQLTALDGLLRRLPEDHSTLPPLNRRLLLEYKIDGQQQHRVYDTANAPRSAWRVLSMARLAIDSTVLKFSPEKQVAVWQFSHDGFMRTSLDGAELLTASMNGPLQKWDAKTLTLKGSIPQTNEILWEELAFSGDGRFAVASSQFRTMLLDAKDFNVIHRLYEPTEGNRFFRFKNPQFTRDGKYLFMECATGKLCIFDTVSWKTVANLPTAPTNITQFLPAARGSRAIARTSGGEIILWDTEQGRSIATLEHSASILKVVFSPDESLVAVAISLEGADVKWSDKRHLKIWKTHDGELYREPLAYEREFVGAEAICWSNDARYLLVGRQFASISSREIAIWNMESGRHRASLTGPLNQVLGLELLPGGDQIAAMSEDGVLRVWDLAKVLKSVQQFEQGLPAIYD